MKPLIKRQLLCSDKMKQKKDKSKFDLQFVNIPHSVVPLNRFTMLSIVLLSHFVSGKCSIFFSFVKHMLWLLLLMTMNVTNENN